jgi:hypothetical protein
MARSSCPRLPISAIPVGVCIEDISRLIGHSVTGVTVRVYHHQLRAVLDEGAAVMDDIFPLDDAG